MESPIFELVEVSRQFGALTALCNISLTLRARERVALVGPSGAGKSTLLQILNGSLAPSSGQVRVFGIEWQGLGVRQRRQIQRQIGTVYQQHHLVPHLAVIHNVNAGQLGQWSLAKAAWSLLWPQDAKTARRALEQVGIEEKLYTRTDQLSGGQQQRVAIARILVQNPAVILADEPIASVDPARAHDLMRLFCHLAETSGKTLVVSLHDIQFALKYCTRLVGLRQGRLQFDAAPDQVTEEMIHDLYRLSHPATARA